MTRKFFRSFIEDEFLLFLCFLLLCIVLCLIPSFAYLGKTYTWFNLVGIKHYLPRISSVFIMCGFFVYSIKNRGWLSKINNRLAIIPIFISFLFLIVYWQQLSQITKFLPYAPPVWVFLIVTGVVVISSYTLRLNLKLYQIIGLFLAFVIIYRSLSGSISSSLFSMHFSESNWLYSANQISDFLKHGKNVEWPLLDPFAKILLAIPLLFGVKSIVVYRIINFIIRTLILGFASWAIVKRLMVTQKKDRIIAMIWVFIIFLFLPIPVHVLPGMILILVFFDKTKFVKSLLVVLLASALVGVTRINWFPAPSMLAIILHLHESRSENTKWKELFLKYFTLGIVGFFSALIAYFAYLQITGNPLIYLNPEYSYVYIFERLFPNSVLFPGSLLGILLLTIPLIIIVFHELLRERNHLFRLLVVFLTLFSTFIVGTIISARIGGGYDFHNFDLYVFFVIINAGYCLTNDPQAEKQGLSKNGVWRLRFVTLFSILFIIINGFFPLMNIDFSMPENRELTTIQRILGGTNEPVLLMSQQHLPILGYLKIKNPDYRYDYVDLSEMLMAQNVEGIENFIQDLESHKWSYILSPNITALGIQSSDTNPFAEENNLWAEFDQELSELLQIVHLSNDYALAIYKVK